MKNTRGAAIHVSAAWITSIRRCPAALRVSVAAFRFDRLCFVHPLISGRNDLQQGSAAIAAVTTGVFFHARCYISATGPACYRPLERKLLMLRALDQISEDRRLPRRPAGLKPVQALHQDESLAIAADLDRSCLPHLQDALRNLFHGLRFEPSPAHKCLR